MLTNIRRGLAPIPFELHDATTSTSQAVVDSIAAAQ